METIEFEIETTPIKRCTRCNYSTTSETSIRSHILDKTCPKGSASYTDDGMVML